jgi:hypothetical protein
MKDTVLSASFEVWSTLLPNYEINPELSNILEPQNSFLSLLKNNLFIGIGEL